MTVRLYNTQRCPYARRTRMVLHEKEEAFRKYKQSWTEILGALC